MRVVISGASGLIGTALSESLRADGHEVIALVRREARTQQESAWSPSTHHVDEGVIASADAVVNLAGASIGARRLTRAYKREVLASRVDATTTLATAIAAADAPARLIQASSMGYYGARGDDELTEQSQPGSGFLAEVCQAWEAASEPASRAGSQVIFARTGLVLAGHGGFAERLVPLARRGLIGGFGNGRAFQSWITLHDHIRAMRLLLTADIEGPVNVIAPEAARDGDLVRSLSAAFGRRPGLRVPRWALHLVIGEAANDLLASQRGIPTVLTAAGFAWDHATLASACAYVAGADAAAA